MYMQYKLSVADLLDNVSPIIWSIRIDPLLWFMLFLKSFLRHVLFFALSWPRRHAKGHWHVVFFNHTLNGREIRQITLKLLEC